MTEIRQTETFQKWRENLKDDRARSIIAARIIRLQSGLMGNVEPIGEGISEAKIDYGPGYRLYFKRHGNTLIVLLCGGDKSTQSQDIKAAKILARQWKPS